MLQSTGFEQPKACGAAIAQLQAEGSAALGGLGLSLPPGTSAAALDAAMATWREAQR